jgi:hypothetical protein
MAAKPLPDDREVLLRMLDEMTAFLRHSEQGRSLLELSHSMRQDPEVASAQRFFQEHIKHIQQGRFPARLHGQLKHYSSVLEPLASLKERLETWQLSPRPEMVLCVPYLELPANPRALIREGEPGMPALLDRIMEPGRRLHRAILDKLAGLKPSKSGPKARPKQTPPARPRPPRETLDERATLALKKNPGLTFAQLAEMLGCHASTLRDRKKCPLLAAARASLKAARMDFRGAGTWWDRREGHDD